MFIDYFLLICYFGNNLFECNSGSSSTDLVSVCTETCRRGYGRSTRFLHACMHACSRWRANLDIFLGCCPPSGWRQSLSQAWDLSGRVGWTESKPQGSGCLYLPSWGYKHLIPHLVFDVGAGDRTQVFSLVWHLTVGAINPGPGLSLEVPCWRPVSDRLLISWKPWRLNLPWGYFRKVSHAACPATAVASWDVLTTLTSLPAATVDTCHQVGDKPRGFVQKRVLGFKRGKHTAVRKPQDQERSWWAQERSSSIKGLWYQERLKDSGTRWNDCSVDTVVKGTDFGGEMGVNSYLAQWLSVI